MKEMWVWSLGREDPLEKEMATHSRGILVPQPKIGPVPPAVEAQSPNHWTTKDYELPMGGETILLIFVYCTYIWHAV